ncbi:MAG: M48 family metalloprotease [Desulfobulbus sp.]|nr:M48 family metalloprotease [Desulfobulbus sp.]
MLYNNLLYFLVVIFVFSTNTPAAKPALSMPWTLVAIGATYWLYAQIAARLYARAGHSPNGYFAAEKKLSILAVVVFMGLVYLLDIKHFLNPLSLGGRLPVLSDLAGLAGFFLLLALMWRAARNRYEQIFQRAYSTLAFIRSNFKANLPIVLPWLSLSLVFDALQLLPFPQLRQLLRSPWGDLVLFLLFLVFLTLVFPPLVRFLWGCTPLPASPLRDRLLAFCKTQGFDSEIYIWPLFEGQVLTAGIMGIVPKLRYLLITPALLETLNQDELDSVLAHEIGHVKHLHLILYMTLFLGFSLLAGAVATPLPHLILSSDLFYTVLPYLPFSPENVLGVLATVPLLALMLVYFRFIFGYFIRNFERQADAYVFHAQGTSWPLINSFEKIASLSGGNRDEKNWHHYGIGERIDYLHLCENDRTQITRHKRKLHRTLLAYFVIIGLLVFGLHHMNTGKLSEEYEAKYAEAVLMQKVRQEPKNSLWLIYLGDFLQSRQMEHKAVEAYERAIKLTPMNAELNNNLAWLLLTTKDPTIRNADRALTLALTAAMINERGHVLDTLATAYWANGMIDKAVETEQRAFRLDPKNQPYYLEQLGKFKSKRWDEENLTP